MGGRLSLGTAGVLLLTAVLLPFTAACHLHWGVHATRHQGPDLERVAHFERMPTTMALAPDGRLFVSFPNWWSQPEIAVGQLKSGAKDGSRVTPYPDRAWNAYNGESGSSAAGAFVCVQALYIDRCGRSLWVVDAGNPLRVAGDVIDGGPKLVEIDLATSAVRRAIVFDRTAAPEGSYLNDVRVDHLTGTAYLTDSGLGALLVVDLKTSATRRVLDGHASTQAEGHVVPIVGGRAWRAIGGFAPRVHADGIALSPDGTLLYFHAVTGRTLYRVPTDALRDRSLDATELAQRVEAVAHTSAVDGMWMDLDGSLYLTAIEHDAIERRLPSGAIETVVRDGRIQWPDAVLVSERDGERHLYFSASQIHKSRVFNSLVDVRTTPYELFRVPMVETGLARERVAGCEG